MTRRLALVNDHEYGNGIAIFTRDGDAARDFAARVPGRHGGHQRADSGAARLSHLRRLEALRPSAISTSTGPTAIRFYTKTKTVTARWPQRHQGRRAVLHPDDAVMGDAKDCNGNILNDGNSVTVIKDLKVRGAGETLKRGTLIKNIRLTDDPGEIEGRTGSIKGLVLKTAFVKKA